MDIHLLQPFCNACSSFSRQPAIHRQLFSRTSITNYPANTSPKCRNRKTTSELQAPVSATAQNGTGFSPPSVPSHKVTVHDRQRCCTSCAVRVKSGQLRQPEALGISAELKSKGYALLCVGFPSSDLEVETQDEDEVYWLQFGRYFARGPVERDDYALELAMGDE